MTAPDRPFDTATDILVGATVVAQLLRTIADDSDSERTQALIRELGRELDLIRELFGDLTGDLPSSLDFLNRAFAVSRGLLHDLDHANTNAFSPDLARDIASELTDVVDKAIGAGAPLKEGASTDPAASRASAPIPPSWRAMQLSAAAVRLLPAAHRARFGEEFHAELHDLAASGAGRGAQLGHALRLLTRACSHRRALGAPHPGRKQTL